MAGRTVANSFYLNQIVFPLTVTLDSFNTQLCLKETRQKNLSWSA